jgi:hypothetical protein
MATWAAQAKETRASLSAPDDKLRLQVPTFPIWPRKSASGEKRKQKTNACEYRPKKQSTDDGWNGRQKRSANGRKRHGNKRRPSSVSWRNRSKSGKNKNDNGNWRKRCGSVKSRNSRKEQTKKVAANAPEATPG